MQMIEYQGETGFFMTQEDFEELMDLFKKNSELVEKLGGDQE